MKFLQIFRYKTDLSSGLSPSDPNPLWKAAVGQLSMHLLLMVTNISVIWLFFIASPCFAASPDFFWGFSFIDEGLLPEFELTCANATRPTIDWHTVEPIIENIPLKIEDVTWEMVENYAYNDPSKHWESYDSLVHKLYEQGIRSIFVICNGYTNLLPEFQSGGTLKRATPDNLGREYYLGHVFLHARAAARRYKECINIWQTENELNRAPETVIWGWREGLTWFEWDFLTTLLETLRQAVLIENQNALTTLNFHTDLPGWLAHIPEWQHLVDIIGMDAYPNYVFGYPIFSQAASDRVRMIQSLGFKKPVVVLETGYPSKPFYKNFNEDYQAQYVDESMKNIWSAGASGYFYLGLKSSEQGYLWPPFQVVEGFWGFIRKDGSYKPAHDKYTNNASTLTLDTGWEKGQNQGLQNLRESSNAVSGPVKGYDPVCMPLKAPGPCGIMAHSGEKYEALAGIDLSTTENSYCYFKVFETDIFVSPGLTVSFWIYNHSSPRKAAANVCIDAKILSEGFLRDYVNEDYLRDQNGVRIHPAYRNDPLGEWIYVEVDLSPAAGEVLDYLMFGYDDPYPEFSINPAGRWISFIDDLEFRIK